MPLKTAPWDPAAYLNTPGRIAAYLEEAFKDGDPALIAAALDHVAKARHRALTNAEGEVRELTAEDAAAAVPFSALPEAEQRALRTLRKHRKRS